MVAPGTAACAAAVALVRSSPVSGASVIPFAACGPGLAGVALDESVDDVSAVDVELVCACAVPITDAPTAPPVMAAPIRAPLSSAFCPNFMMLLRELGTATTVVAGSHAGSATDTRNRLRHSK